MARPTPPAYAWDWFARQRLLWRECRARLVTGGSASGRAYLGVEERAEVLARLREQYPDDEAVARVVDAVVTEVAFLDRTDRPFAQLGFRTAPRGLRWWWTAVTGEELDRPPAARGRLTQDPRQLQLLDLAALDPEHALDDVAEGYGDHAR